LGKPAREEFVVQLWEARGRMEAATPLKIKEAGHHGDGIQPPVDTAFFKRKIEPAAAMCQINLSV
jgi:hypothetical protein